MFTWLWAYFQNLKKKPTSAPTPLPVQKPPLVEVLPKPIVKTMPEKIYELAKSCLGKDIAATQNELGCAEAISYILAKVTVHGFPKTGYLSTSDLYFYLKSHADLVTEPLPGDIIISPTGTSTTGAKHGHVGIVGRYGIMSNNSMTGLFQQNYTIEQWKAYYGKKLGFPTLFYRVDN